MSNILLHGLADAVGLVLSGQSPKLFMYIEFHDDDSPTAPSFNKESGVEYYLGLNPTEADFLRVPLIAPLKVDASSGYSSNKMVATAVTQGDEGHLGLSFGGGDTHIIGAAVVLVRDVEDATKDVVIARGYFNPIAVGENQHVSIVFPFTLKVGENA